MPNACVAPNCKVGYKPKKKKKKKVGDENGVEDADGERGEQEKSTVAKHHTYHFPDEKAERELWEKWKNAVPRKEANVKDWKGPSKHSVLCDKHFLPSDFKEEPLDSNTSRKYSKGSMKRRELKPNAVPSQWSGCPNLLSKPPPVERPTSSTTSDARHEKQREIEQRRLEEERIKDWQ